MNWGFIILSAFKITFGLLFAVFLFVWRLKGRKNFALRFMLSVTVFTVYTFSLFPALMLLGFNSQGLFIGNFLVMLAMLVLEIWVCFDCSFFTALALGASACATQHIASDFVGILECFGFTSASAGEVLYNAVEFAILFAVFAFSYWAFARKVNIVLETQFAWQSILLSFFIVLATGLLVNIFDGIEGIQPTAMLGIYIYDIIVLIVCLSMLYGLFSNSKLKTEIENTKLALHMKQNYYQISKENIDLISIKCHDMKHQLMALNLDGGRKPSPEFARQVENVINVYDMISKTGNEALDVVITEKSFVCENSGIRFTCMADGSGLSFMEDMDIYSLFGNALDNAIDSVKKLTDEEKRIIDLLAVRNGNLVRIEVSNYYEGELSFRDGLPVTTKANDGYHGHGLKSIRMIIEKYDGSFHISTDEGMFRLTLVLPLPLSLPVH